MAGFRKAKPEQASLKLSMFGPPGSGKTFTALLMAEYLANASKKRIAFVDTERGTDFYAQKVPDRKIHPEAFDFDAIYTRSLTDIIRECKGLNPAEHSVIIIDSMTHVWEAAKAAFSGKTNKAGQIPLYAWGGIKKPYRDLMGFLINSPYHVLILGRQGSEFGEDENTGEMKQTGLKMKAEGETAYEPHICLRMESVRSRKGAEAVPVCFVEKDRTGLLQGKIFTMPTAEMLVAPMLPLLGMTQAQMETEDEAGQKDAEALAKADREKANHSATQRENLKARFALTVSLEEVEKIGKSITPDMKKAMLTHDVNAVKEFYLEAVRRVKAGGLVEAGVNGHHEREPGEEG